MTRHSRTNRALALALLATACADGGEEHAADAEALENEAGPSDAGDADGSDAMELDAADRDTSSPLDAGDQPDATADAARPEDARASGDASIDDVDLTLGGFNQDLPAPSIDCVRKADLRLGCMSVSGTYNGDSFQFSCEENMLTVGMTASHLLGCRGPTATGDLVVELRLQPELIAARGAVFSAISPATYTFVSVWHLLRQFASYPDGVFELEPSHEQSIHVSGISEAVPRGTPTSPRDDWRIRGAFGLSLTPKPSCVPDAMARGCDEVKLRANFSAYPIE